MSFILRAGAVLVCLFVSAKAQQSVAHPDPLHAVHDALFASFLPVDELPNDPKDTGLLIRARDGMWQGIAGRSDIRGLLLPFADLRPLGQACGIDAVLKGTGTYSFARLTPVKRQEILRDLQNCDLNPPRRLAATVRNLYLVKGYEAVQEPLTGEVLNLYAPQAYLDTHGLKLPPTRLAYDRQHKELREADGHAIDVLIVGSGPAGSVLAHELRKGGKRVVLLERGPFTLPGSMDTGSIEDLVDNRTSQDGGIRIRNGVAVGGGTQVNVDLSFAPTSEAVRTRIEGWRKDGRIAPGEFSQTEIAKAYDWVEQTVGTRKLTESEINANNRVLWDGALAEGLHPKLYRLNEFAPGKSPSPVTSKRSAETELLLAALEDSANPLSMVPDADVQRVLFEGREEQRRAVGVEVKAREPWHAAAVIADPNRLTIPAGEVYTVHAKTVILCAGALGSPTILLHSHLGNDQVGRGVILHPSMPIMGLFNRPIHAMEGTRATVYVDDRLVDRGYAFEAMSAPPLYAALMSPGPALHSFRMVQGYRDLAGFGVMLVDTPDAKNHLFLDNSGEPQIAFTLSEADKKRFAEGIAEAVRVMFRAGAKEVYLPTTENLLGATAGRSMQPQVLTSAGQARLIETNLHFISNRSLITSAHMQGTDKMGASPANSVVGFDFHVWGTRELYVVDGSVFPTSIGANPMQSIYTIAKIFAEHWDGSREK